MRLPPNCRVARACCALSASPSRASWHDSCRWAARQMLMRTALWHVRLARHAEMCSTLYGTCHHAVRRVQRARQAHAAFSAVSCAVCARSSAMPAVSLIDVLGDSTAAPTGGIVLKWEAASGNGALECGKVETGESGTEALAGMDLSGTEGLSGIPSLRARERACAW